MESVELADSGVNCRGRLKVREEANPRRYCELMLAYLATYTYYQQQSL